MLTFAVTVIDPAGNMGACGVTMPPGMSIFSA